MTLNTEGWTLPAAVSKNVFLSCVNGIYRRWVYKKSPLSIHRSHVRREVYSNKNTFEYIKRR